jgi:hypothetical protein
MRLPTLGKAKNGYSCEAYGLQIHLWNESIGDWCATIFDGGQELYFRFEEYNVNHAKLHILAVARNRAMVQWKDREFPAEKTLLESWKPMTSVGEN